MSAVDDTDVPPLEDMSHVFKQPAAGTAAKVSAGSADSKLKNDSCVENSEKAPAGPQKMNSATAAPKQASGFGGMRRGFLAAPSKPTAGSQQPQQQEKKPSNNTSTAEDSNEVPYIRSDPGAAARSLQLDDVQASLAEAQAASSSAPAGWLNDDLLARVEADESLLRGLANPRLSAPLTKFQTDPRRAMEEYKDDTEVQQFLAKFSALLGDHFTRLADQQEQQKNETEKQPQKKVQEIDPEVEEVLSRPGVREALTNPDVQSWMSVLRQDPDRAQGLLRHSRDREFQRRIRLLMENGLIGLAK